jgi:hypothetical protein
MENMFELLATEPRTKDDPGAPPLRVTEGRVEFRSVVFGYHVHSPVLKVRGKAEKKTMRHGHGLSCEAAAKRTQGACHHAQHGNSGRTLHWGWTMRQRRYPSKGLLYCSQTPAKCL